MKKNLDDSDYNLLCTKLENLERQTEEVCEKYEQTKVGDKRKPAKRNRRMKNKTTKNLNDSDCNLLCTKVADLERPTEEVCKKYEQTKVGDERKRAKRNRRTKKNSKNNLDGSGCNLLCKKLTDCQTEKVCEKNEQAEEADKEESQTYILKPQEERYISVRNIADLQESTQVNIFFNW